MLKLLSHVTLFLILALPYSVFSHSDSEHEHDNPAADASSQMESGTGWKVIRTLEMGNSGKFVHMVLVDHDKHTDKTIYSAAINRLCQSDQDFCRIRFWSQERYIPEKTSLTTEQNKHLKADYMVNKTAGTHHLLWSCSVNPEKGQCFKN